MKDPGLVVRFSGWGISASADPGPPQFGAGVLLYNPLGSTTPVLLEKIEISHDTTDLVASARGMARINLIIDRPPTPGQLGSVAYVGGAADVDGGMPRNTRFGVAADSSEVSQAEIYGKQYKVSGAGAHKSLVWRLPADGVFTVDFRGEDRDDDDCILLEPDTFCMIISEESSATVLLTTELFVVWHWREQQ